jgi:hypothetical protein
MQEAMTATVVANLVRMLRTGDEFIAICIVEGGDDKKHFKALFDERRCRFVIANGWESAICALEESERTGYKGITAIIDADHRYVTGEKPSTSNLFYSDFHDLEIDLIHTTAFDRLVDEVCDMEARKHPPADELRSILFRLAAPLGYLRLYSTQNKLGFKFKTLTYSAFIDEGSMTLDWATMVREVKNKSQRHDLSDAALLTAAKELEVKGLEPRALCRGHDVTAILSLGLRKRFGNQQPSNVTPERLEQMLRAAYRWEHFTETRLYKSLLWWESVNPPYVLLRQHSQLPPTTPREVGRP